jgi:hypothetical protein
VDWPGKAIGSTGYATAIKRARHYTIRVKNVFSICKELDEMKPTDLFCLDPKVVINVNHSLYKNKRLMNRMLSIAGINGEYDRAVARLGVYLKDLIYRTDYITDADEEYVFVLPQLVRRIRAMDTPKLFHYYARHKDNVTQLHHSYNYEINIDTGMVCGLDTLFPSDGFDCIAGAIYLSPEKLAARVMFVQSSDATDWISPPDDEQVYLMHQQMTQLPHFTVFHNNIVRYALYSLEDPLSTKFSVIQMSKAVMSALNCATILAKRIILTDGGVSRYRSWTFDMPFPFRAKYLKHGNDLPILASICHLLVHWDVPQEVVKFTLQAAGKEMDDISFRIIGSYISSACYYGPIDNRPLEHLMSTGIWLTSLYMPNSNGFSHVQTMPVNYSTNYAGKHYQLEPYKDIDAGTKLVHEAKAIDGITYQPIYDTLRL